MLVELVMILLWYAVYTKSKTFFSREKITKHYSLITGATGDIGFALASQLHTKGTKLICTGRDASQLSKLQTDYNAITFQFDFSSSENFENALESILKENKIDKNELKHVFLNHGYGVYQPFVETPNPGEFLSVNLTSYVEISHFLLKNYTLKSLTFTSSCIAYKTAKNYLLYHLSKLSILQLAKSLRKENSIVKIAAICPQTVRNGKFFTKKGMENSTKLTQKLRNINIFTVKSQKVARKLIKGAEFGTDINVGVISKIMSIFS